MKILLTNYKDLLANLPSWVEQRLVPVSYASKGAGINIEVKEIKPQLELPYLPRHIRGFAVSEHFTVAEVSKFLMKYGGTHRNYAVHFDGKFYRILHPFIVVRGKRVHITEDELELANILSNVCYRESNSYMEFLAAKEVANEAAKESKSVADSSVDTDLSTQYRGLEYGL